MKRFCAADGHLHFLFAEEDDYYLDSLLRLDLKQYLYYCLKREGYRSVFFLNGAKKHLQLDTLELTSMDEFQKAGAKGFKALFAQPFKTRRIKEHGHPLYEAELSGEEWQETLCSLLEKKQSLTTFVVPIGLFFDLYRDEEAAEELAGRMQEYGRRVIFVILAPVCADASMHYLLARDGPFCSRLCPEVLRVVNRAKKVLLYEEMERELTDRFQVWNQMEREELLRMLRWGVLMGGRPWPEEEEILRDAAELIYFWYHSPLFAAELPGLFPEAQERRLSAVSAALQSPEVWRRILEKREELRRNAPEDMSLAKLLRPDYPAAERFHPQRRPGSVLRRLKACPVSRLVGGEGTVRFRQAGARIMRLQEDMQRVYSDAGLYREDEWLEFCLDGLQELEACGARDADAVERILNFLEYLVLKDERQRRPELFLEKAEYYRQIVELSLETVRGRQTIAEYGERAGESREKRDALLSEILRIQRESPELEREAAAAVAGGGFSGEYLALSAKKAELVRLDEECRNAERFAADLAARLSLYGKVIGQLTLSIDKLSEGSLTELSETMRNAAGAVQRKEIARARLYRELEGVMKEQEADAPRTHLEEMSGQEIDEEFARIVRTVLEEPGREKEYHA